MTYLGDFKGYQVYQNDEGNLEAYKASGIVLKAKINVYKNSSRIVSNTSDLDLFIKNYLTKKRTKAIKQDSSNQLKLL